MEKDKHFNRRIWFLLIVLVLLGCLFVARLVQIQLVEGTQTLQDLRENASSAVSGSASSVTVASQS